VVKAQAGTQEEPHLLSSVDKKIVLTRAQLYSLELSVANLLNLNISVSNQVSVREFLLDLA
jgi:hypothetical protein